LIRNAEKVMSLKIVPVSELRQRLREILETLDRTGEAHVVTQHSHPRAVIARYEDYQHLADRAEEVYPYIVRKPGISGGEPIIRGTRISVRHLAERIRAGQPVDEILAALPHLSAAQVHAALTYYYDHQAEVDHLIEENTPEQVAKRHGLRLKRLGGGAAVAEPAHEA
jgi:prevent-host-death family protein